MIEFLVDKIHDARFMTMLLAAIAVSATAYTLIMPLFAGEGLAKRMKAVASERERLRQRERRRQVHYHRPGRYQRDPAKASDDAREA